MRILGIDPGSRITGFGIIEISAGKALYVNCGIIRMNSKEMPPRLVLLQQEIQRILNEYQPNVCAIESLFVQKNAYSALKLGQARGVALCTVASASVPIFEYAPRSIKLAVTGSGAADKNMVQEHVNKHLNLDIPLSIDSSDALAIALTHMLRTLS